MKANPRKVGKLARALFHKQKNLCHYCKINMTLRRGTSTMVTVDHIHPKSQGGTTHGHNTVGACFACNNAKGDMPYEDFKRVVERRGRPDRRPNAPPEFKVHRAEKDKPILESAAPWKKQKLPKAAAYTDSSFKTNALADAFVAAGLVKKEESEC